MIETAKHEMIKDIAERYNLALVYLFGSQADAGQSYMHGDAMEADHLSDLDIAVATEIPQPQSITTYGNLFSEFSDIFAPFSIDLILMHEMDTLFQYEIIKGIRIYEKNEAYADVVEERIMKMAPDLFFKKKMMDREIMEAITDGYFEFEYRPHS